MIATGSTRARNRRARSITRRNSYSGDVDFDLLGLGVLALWHTHGQQTILEFRLYFAGIGIVRQSEAAQEGAVAAFDAVIFPFLLFFFELAFAGDGQNAVLDCDLYVFFFHLRQLGLDEIFLLIFGDVRQRRPVGESDFFPPIPAT